MFYAEEMIVLHAYKNKKVAVLGLGKSGVATIEALVAGGAEIVAWDDGEAARDAATDIPLQPYTAWNWAELAALVVSPSIPLLRNPHPAVMMARSHHLRITCDISLLMEAQPAATMIGITGTNGKSTTTALIAHVLEKSGKAVQCGGNIGVAALSLAPLEQGGYYVLELSSYQLEAMDAGVVNIACWLNITPDHLERHGDMAGYVAAKERIFRGQGAQDIAVIAVDDAYSQAVAARHPYALTVSATHNKAQYVMEGGAMSEQTEGMRAELDLSLMASLQGVHNHQNALVAYAALRAVGLSPAEIADGMQSFAGLPHRMERLAQWDGMLWVNDSKATNADAAEQSLRTYHNVHWIVGGVMKAGGIASLAHLRSHITHAYVIGVDSAEVERSLVAMDVPYTVSVTLAQAVQEAYVNARGSEAAVILLAPAAASFDQFQNFEDRGDQFRALVSGLKGG
jgi:UDP-N-acetylmuramoylalanine--D-glutamate ligase